MEEEKDIEKVKPSSENLENENDTEDNKEKDKSEGFKMPSMPPPSLPAKRKSDVKKSDDDSTPSNEENKTIEKDTTPVNTEQKEPKAETKPSPVEYKSGKSPAEIAKAKSIPLAYQEPSWGGIPDQEYYLEVLKNGTIVDTIHLKDKSYFVIGRLATCDIMMEHPSLSRHHAVLQFKSKGSPEKPIGFYLYDLDSTHGSYHNKNKCFPKTYYRLRVGHMLKFGMSTRSLILQGPQEDEEEESELSITELKAMAAEKAKKKEEERQAALKKLEEGEEDRENDERESAGVSWGMADDAEDFPDMEQNPFAETADNEKLYINDPKKALKNWFDREGYELEYEVEEKGYAQFLCKISLPVDAPSGVNTVAEATVKGKKKEATVQAALEACRILDRLNLLNPSQQSAAEKKVKRWEEDDFYASDEDEFLDRTGTIEKKRKQRMIIAGKVDDKAETYESLLAKHKINKDELDQCEKELKEALARKDKADEDSENLDLDSYLAELKKGAQVDKQTIQKIKVRISSLQQELDKLTKLINIAKPASMPELKPTNPEKPKLSGIMIGKRGSKGLLGKVKNVPKEQKNQVVIETRDTKVLEAFLDADKDNSEKPKRSRLDNSDNEDDEIKPIGYEARPEPKPKERIGDTSINAINKILGPRGPQIPENLRGALEQKLKGADIEAVAKEIKETLAKHDTENALPMEVDSSKLPDDENNDNCYEEEPSQKRKRGDRGNKRKKKAEEDGENDGEGDEADSYYKIGADSKYDVWLPPQGQTGDGRTSLNDKLGY